VMEDGDGYKACRTIKKNPAFTNIPVFMVSSKSNPVDKQWAKQLGATDYIVKPYADSEILEKLVAV
ncbi:MAG: response regulator, partial [Cocleimonas sp.]